jgi:hypothetical protein
MDTEKATHEITRMAWQFAAAHPCVTSHRTEPQAALREEPLQEVQRRGSP